MKGARVHGWDREKCMMSLEHVLEVESKWSEVRGLVKYTQKPT
jgi:hypothetical protein